MTPFLRDLSTLSAPSVANLRFVLCDIDDTLTHDGRLPACSFTALERLHDSGIKIIPITGGAAGWCDMIARYWPVDAVIGESGAFYFRKGRDGRVTRRYWQTDTDRAGNRAKLDRLGDAVLAAIPGTALAADQKFRECDLAIDYSQDVPRLPEAEVARVVEMLTQAGAKAQVSSIHVNSWLGDYDKHRMAMTLLAEIHGVTADMAHATALFVGDAPNDAPMFAQFPLSVGVANIRRFTTTIAALPRYVTPSEGGHGFAELAQHLLRLRAVAP